MGEVASLYNRWGIAAGIKCRKPVHFVDKRVIRPIIKEIGTTNGDDGGK
jgi:hypothetical protein